MGAGRTRHFSPLLATSRFFSPIIRPDFDDSTAGYATANCHCFTTDFTDTGGYCLTATVFPTDFADDRGYATAFLIDVHNKDSCLSARPVKSVVRCFCRCCRSSPKTLLLLICENRRNLWWPLPLRYPPVSVKSVVTQWQFAVAYPALDHRNPPPMSGNETREMDPCPHPRVHFYTHVRAHSPSRNAIERPRAARPRDVRRDTLGPGRRKAARRRR